MFINHVHLMPAELRADATLEHFLATIPPVAEEIGIPLEGAVCFAPFSYQFGNIHRADDPNIWLRDTLAAAPAGIRLVGYGTLDPNRPARPQVERITALGFRGIKLHPPAQKFAIFGDWAREAYAAMEEHDLVADFHIGMHWYRLKDYDPLLCDEIAWHHPRLRMVFEHVGGWHYYRQVLAVITNNTRRGNHLYAGIASVLDRENQRYWWLGTDGLDDCRWQIGGDLLIHGLDFPYNQAAALRRDLELIRTRPWPQGDIAALLGGNLKRLLGLSSGQARTVGGDPVRRSSPQGENADHL
ncbi:MAG: amidohydrolase family protein [Opitutaceae bacterium]|jgi:predicted TIM-barrel fold metal-dependent hydrolase|nr:amidohydrolase family protein [Opitutaceae bacterium]